jgi:hypothetical protein
MELPPEYPPVYRVVYDGRSPRLRLFGCLGCLSVIFVLGGIMGVLLFGWKTLLGM